MKVRHQPAVATGGGVAWVGGTPSTGRLSIISAITEAGERDPVGGPLGGPEACRGVVPAARETGTSPHKWVKGVHLRLRVCATIKQFFNDVTGRDQFNLES